MTTATCGGGVGCWLDAIDRRLRSAIDGAAAILLAAVTCLGIAQVFWRYVLNSSLIWSEELIRLLFVWLILVGAATAPHMRIDLLTDLLGRRWRLALEIGRKIVVLALLGLLLDSALQLTARFGSDSFVTLGISKSWYWSAAITGMLLWAGTIVSGTVLAVLGRRDAE